MKLSGLLNTTWATAYLKILTSMTGCFSYCLSQILAWQSNDFEASGFLSIPENCETVNQLMVELLR